MSEYSKTAISWMGLRDALLYFPYVVSLFEIEHLGSGRLAGTRFLRAHERTFLPPDVPQTAVTDLKGIIKAVRSLKRHIEEQAMKATPDSSALSAINQAFEGEPGKAIKRAMLSFYVHYKPSRNLPLITASNLGTKSTESEDIAINIALLKLIDTRALTLEQLLEFRKDQEAMNKLRRFRLYLRSDAR